jgi:hypothetical protein
LTISLRSKRARDATKGNEIATESAIFATLSAAAADSSAKGEAKLLKGESGPIRHRIGVEALQQTLRYAARSSPAE